jgi:type II secretory pathway component PulF
MPDVFSYRARDAHGALVAGKLRSNDRDGVIRYLDEQQLIPIAVDITRPSLAETLNSLLKRGPGLETRILFTRKFATLYSSGIPILRALSLLAEQEKDPLFRAVLLDVHKQVEGGLPLWEAMQEHPLTFGHVFVQAIKTGEASGKLDEVLQKTADFMEREMTTREEVRGAVRYPVMVVCAMAAAFIVIVTFVIPKFAAVYGKFGAQLPLPTRLLIWASRVIAGGWYWFVPLICAAVYGAFRWLKTDRGTEWKDRWLLKLPALGPLFMKVAIARFAHMLSILFESGLPMIESLAVVAQSVGNRIIAGEIMKIAENFRRGKEAMDQLEEGGVFPPLAVQMMRVGLETGALGRMLGELAGHYDREVKYASRRLTNVLEPFLIFGLSGLVLLMALAVLLPMWNLISVFKQH